MKTCASPLRLVAAAFFGLLPLPLCSAANLSLRLTAQSPAAADPAYPGSGSTVSTEVDTPTTIITTLSGRNYGANPAPGSSRWGIRAGSLPNANRTGFVVTNGFSPAAPGSTQNTAGTGASYVSIRMTNVQPNTLFQNISIDFSGLTNTRTTNAWGASSVGNFTTWAAATTNGGGGTLRVDLPDFTYSGGLLEFRIYGLVSDDIGSFASVRLHAGLGTAPAVPEPGCFILAAMGLAVIFGRRQR